MERLNRRLAKAKSKDRLKALPSSPARSTASSSSSATRRCWCRSRNCSATPTATLLDKSIHDALRSYRRSLSYDRKLLLESYRYVHVARKVVGVGSVGTRAWVVLFTGRDDTDPLILQVKEARSIGARGATPPRASSPTTANGWSKASG